MYLQLLRVVCVGSRHSVLAVTADCACRFPDWRQKMMQLVIMFLHVRE